MQKQRGFTIVELMVSTVVFSLILLLALAGILQITRMYFRSVNTSRTQDTARSIVDELAETLRYTNTAITWQNTNTATGGEALVTGPEVATAPGTDDTNYFCIGNKRYTYAIDRQLKTNPVSTDGKQKRHVLWVDQPDDSCTVDVPNLSNAIPSPTGSELLLENMRIFKLDITPLTSVSAKTYRITIGVAYGDDNGQNGGALITDGANRKCDSTLGGFAYDYCAVSIISVLAERRLQ